MRWILHREVRFPEYLVYARLVGVRPGMRDRRLRERSKPLAVERLALRRLDKFPRPGVLHERLAVRLVLDVRRYVGPQARRGNRAVNRELLPAGVFLLVVLLVLRRASAAYVAVHPGPRTKVRLVERIAEHAEECVTLGDERPLLGIVHYSVGENALRTGADLRQLRVAGLRPHAVEAKPAGRHRVLLAPVTFTVGHHVVLERPHGAVALVRDAHVERALFAGLHARHRELHLHRSPLGVERMDWMGRLADENRGEHACDQ